VKDRAPVCLVWDTRAKPGAPGTRLYRAGHKGEAWGTRRKLAGIGPGSPAEKGKSAPQIADASLTGSLISRPGGP